MGTDFPLWVVLPLVFVLLGGVLLPKPTWYFLKQLGVVVGYILVRALKTARIVVDAHLDLLYHLTHPRSVVFPTLKGSTKK